MFESILYEFIKKIKKSFFHFIEKEEWYVVTVNTYQYVFGAKSKKTKEIICLYSFSYDPVHQIVELNSKYHRPSVKRYFPTVYESFVEFLQEQGWDCFVRTSTISTIGFSNKELEIRYTGNRTKMMYNWLENAIEVWERSYIMFQQKNEKISICHRDIEASFDLKWNVQGVFIDEKKVESKSEWTSFFRQIQDISEKASHFRQELYTLIKKYDEFYQALFNQKQMVLFQQKKECRIELKSLTAFELKLDKQIYFIANNEDKKQALKKIERYVKKERLKAVVEGRNKTM